jgi:hypothetical protein
MTLFICLVAGAEVMICSERKVMLTGGGVMRENYCWVLAGG